MENRKEVLEIKENLAGDLDCRGYKIVTGERLIKCKNIDASDAEFVGFPELDRAHDIIIKNATNADFTKIQETRCFDGRKLPLFSATEYCQSGHIYLMSAKFINLPNLKIKMPDKKTPDNLYAFKSDTLIVKEVSGKLYCNNKTDVYGKYGKIMRNDNWIFINNNVYIVDDIDDKNYHLLSEDGTQKLLAIMNKNGKFNFLTDLVFKNKGRSI